MKKIVFFSHGLSANGIETFLVNVLRKIDKTKYDITVIIAIDEDVYCLHEKTVTDLGIRVIHAGDLDAPKKKLDYIRNVRRILSAEHFDIAHSNMDLLNGITLTIAKKCGIPMRICHAHNSKSQYDPVGRFASLKKLLQRIYSRTMKGLIIRSSTELLACSDVASEYFYGERKSTLIYNGIDTESYKKTDNFDALSYARKLGADGRDKAEQLGVTDRIIFTGVRTDVKEILACCDCFLMPSLFEGLPFSLIEAQAAGLRCIVSDVVTREADVGLIEYFSLENGEKKWAEFINAKLDEPRKSADENKLRQFDISHTVRQLEEIYDR